MIDIHSHILPGIDDGSKSIEDTLEMLRNAEREETTDIVATPHYCIGYGEETYSNVKNMVKELNEILKNEHIDIKVHYGQEVYYSERLLEDLEEGVIGTINGGRYLLIEFNMRDLEEELFDIMYELKIKGIIPIVAHPERYSYIQRHPSLIKRFVEEGCLFQLNSGSIEGLHGKEAKKCAELLISKKIYSFIGSDAHNNKNRKTGIRKGIYEVDKIFKGYEDIFIENGEKLLRDEEIVFYGELIEKKKRKKKRGLFSLFMK